MTKCIRLLALCFVAVPAASAFAQHSGMKPGMTHEEHQAQIEKDAAMKKRGAAAMGFDQDATTHHFRLLSDGGAIEVAVNDQADIATRDQVRGHLKDIAAAFSQGDFSKPFATHGEIPPGVKVMQERKRSLTFSYEATDDGGRVRIVTADARAKSAVHEFLRYQIREHATAER
jgi:hypothetical protein